MSEVFSPLAQWFCSQKCHNRRERDCYTEAMSRVVCQCRAPPGTRGGTQAQEADSDRLELVIPERSPLINERKEKRRPIVVNVIERNLGGHVEF